METRTLSPMKWDTAACGSFPQRLLFVHYPLRYSFDLLKNTLLLRQWHLLKDVNPLVRVPTSNATVNLAADSLGIVHGGGTTHTAAMVRPRDVRILDDETRANLFLKFFPSVLIAAACAKLASGDELWPMRRYCSARCCAKLKGAGTNSASKIAQLLSPRRKLLVCIVGRAEFTRLTAFQNVFSLLVLPPQLLCEAAANNSHCLPDHVAVARRGHTPCVGPLTSSLSRFLLGQNLVGPIQQVLCTPSRCTPIVTSPGILGWDNQRRPRRSGASPLTRGQLPSSWGLRA
mmetsp:Transcript_19914/g.48445  ORF Transcript_19914/g.48445 Transcript_19914/m.48445 type:complete len:288 (+) Transcript_19914:66-929(+)